MHGIDPGHFDGFRSRNLLPPIADRQFWAKHWSDPAEAERREMVLSAARETLDLPWPRLTAGLYADLSRTGNRSHYEQASLTRRAFLGRYVFAASIEGIDGWIDPIIDAIWSICEESSWCIPSHSGQLDPSRKPVVLPAADPAEQMVDLFTAETAAILAEVCTLLETELDAVTPAIRQRVGFEVGRRLFAPVRSGRDYWWRHGLNNWSPWIASNLAIAGGNLLAKAADYADLAGHLLGAAEAWLKFYPADGGCDEGMSYWNAGPGNLLLLDEELRRRSQGAVGIDPERMRGMGRFARAAHMGGGSFACFADSQRKDSPRPHRLAGYARLLDDPGLMRQAWLTARNFDPQARPSPCLDLGYSLSSTCITHNLRALAWLPASVLQGPCPDAPPEPADDWLPHLQVLTCRSSSLSCCIKAGHNSENHNHNDVGQFVISISGEPVVIDVGTGVYDGRSFSARRYEHWYNASVGHTVPVIDGHGQCSGRTFAPDETARLYSEGPAVIFADPPYGADNLCFHQEGTASSLSMELARCYPPEADIKRLSRRMVFDREQQQIVISDELDGGSEKPHFSLCLNCLAEPRREGERWLLGAGSRQLSLTLEGATASVEERDISTDPLLQRAWGDRLWHLRISGTGTNHRARWALCFALRQ